MCNQQDFRYQNDCTSNSGNWSSKKYDNRRQAQESYGTALKKANFLICIVMQPFKQKYGCFPLAHNTEHIKNRLMLATIDDGQSSTKVQKMILCNSRLYNIFRLKNQSSTCYPYKLNVLSCCNGPIWNSNKSNEKKSNVVSENYFRILRQRFKGMKQLWAANVPINWGIKIANFNQLQFDDTFSKGK